MTAEQSDTASLEAAIEHTFTRRDLLLRALTHASFRGESGIERATDADNEQLEFLGDAVLGLTVSEHLFLACPEFDEGRLSNVKSQLVSRKHLAEVARSLEIGRHLVMGRAEDRSGGREKASLLANAFEALLGALYLDGGMDAVRQLILQRIVGTADLRELARTSANNIKTTLEVLARSRDLPKPEYTVHAENSGFPQMFAAEVRVGKELRASGRASSKKGAETAAARVLLDQMEAI